MTRNLITVHQAHGYIRVPGPEPVNEAEARHERLLNLDATLATDSIGLVVGEDGPEAVMVLSPRRGKEELAPEPEQTEPEPTPEPEPEPR